MTTEISAQFDKIFHPLYRDVFKFLIEKIRLAKNIERIQDQKLFSDFILAVESKSESELPYRDFILSFPPSPQDFQVLREELVTLHKRLEHELNPNITDLIMQNPELTMVLDAIEEQIPSFADLFSPARCKIFEKMEQFGYPMEIAASFFKFISDLPESKEKVSFFHEELKEERIVSLPEKKITVWGIHASPNDEAGIFFLENNVIAIGWAEMGDLREVSDLNARIQEIYPGSPGVLNTLKAFAFEMQDGDVVVYQSRRPSLVHLGVITAPYTYDPCPNPRFPHHRPVKWLQHLPRVNFPREALFHQKTLFKISEHAGIFLQALEGILDERRDENAGLRKSLREKPSDELI